MAYADISCPSCGERTRVTIPNEVCEVVATDRNPDAERFQEWCVTCGDQFGYDWDCSNVGPTPGR